MPLRSHPAEPPGSRLGEISCRVKSALILLLTTLVCLALPAAAQNDYPRADFTVGYSYLRANYGEGHGGLVGGAVFSAAYYPRKNVGMVLESSTHHGTLRGNHLDTTLVLFGPRAYFLRSKFLDVFGQLLSGFHYAQVGFLGLQVPWVDDTGFALATGFGFNVPLRGRYALRALQVDYVIQDVDLPTRTGRFNQLADNLRLSTGLVFQLGAR